MNSPLALESQTFPKTQTTQSKKTEMPANQMRYKKPEIIFHTRVVDAQQIMTNYDHHGSKEISGQRWVGERWLVKKTSGLQNTEASPSKEESPKSKIIPEEKTEGKLTKLSLTARLLNEHKERCRLRRGGRENDPSRSPSNSPEKALTTRSSMDAKLFLPLNVIKGEFTPRTPTLSENHRINSERKIVRNASSPSLLSSIIDQLPPSTLENATKFQIRILPHSSETHQNSPISQIHARNGKRISNMRLDDNSPKKTSLLKPIYPTHTLERLSQIETLSKLRGRINQNALFLAKRKEQETAVPNQMLYNSTFSNISGLVTSRHYAGRSPVKLATIEQTRQKEKSPDRNSQRPTGCESPTIEGEFTYRVGLAMTRTSSCSSHPDWRFQEPTKNPGSKSPLLYNNSPARRVTEPTSLKNSPRNNSHFRNSHSSRRVSPVQANLRDSLVVSGISPLKFLDG